MSSAGKRAHLQQLRCADKPMLVLELQALSCAPPHFKQRVDCAAPHARSTLVSDWMLDSFVVQQLHTQLLRYAGHGHGCPCFAHGVPSIARASG